MWESYIRVYKAHIYFSVRKHVTKEKSHCCEKGRTMTCYNYPRYRDFINWIIDTKRGKDLCLHWALPKTTCTWHCMDDLENGLHLSHHGHLGSLHHQVKARSGMPAHSRAHLSESLSKPQMTFAFMARSGGALHAPEKEGVSASVLQEQSNPWESGRSVIDWGCQMAETCIHVWKVSFSNSILIF